MRDPRDDIEADRADAPDGLFFSRRGNWFHDGQRIHHERLAALLSRSVDRDVEGHLVVTTGRDVLPFVAEDAPLIVRSVTVDAVAISLHLSNETSEALSADVCIDDDGRIRVAVRGRRFWALLSRAACQALEPLLIDEHHLALGDRRWNVVSASLRERWDEVP